MEKPKLNVIWIQQIPSLWKHPQFEFTSPDSYYHLVLSPWVRLSELATESPIKPESLDKLQIIFRVSISKAKLGIDSYWKSICLSEIPAWVSIFYFYFLNKFQIVMPNSHSWNLTYWVSQGTLQRGPCGDELSVPAAALAGQLCERGIWKLVLQTWLDFQPDLYRVGTSITHLAQPEN